MQESVEAVEEAFGADVDYAMLIKLYGTDPESERHYIRAKRIGTETHIIQGDPDSADVSVHAALR